MDSFLCFHAETHPSIGCIRVKDVGHLLTLKGTVIRSGATKILEGECEYECTKCKHRSALTLASYPHSWVSTESKIKYEPSLLSRNLCPELLNPKCW